MKFSPGLQDTNQVFEKLLWKLSEYTSQKSSWNQISLPICPAGRVWIIISLKMCFQMLIIYLPQVWIQTMLMQIFDTEAALETERRYFSKVILESNITSNMSLKYRVDNNCLWHLPQAWMQI